MKIMLTGANGQVGWELQRSLAPLGDVVALDRTRCDFSRPESLPSVVEDIKPDVIINAAAYTAVDKAEEEEVLATTINSTAVGVLAEEAKKLKALFIHYSTDYVFDGANEREYSEEDNPNPINAYGRSKLAGEEVIKQVGGQYMILRASWVYAARGDNFAKTILRLAQERDNLSVVSDQIGAPTNAELIADVTALIIYRLKLQKDLVTQVSGIYNLSPDGETSWHGFAEFVLHEAKNKGVTLRTTADSLRPICSSEYHVSAKRPLNSRLNTRKLSETFELQLPTWRQGVKRMLAEIF